MHQAVDSAGQTDKDTEVRNRFNLALDMIALVVSLAELFPGISLALLHTQRDTTTFFVDIQNLHFDFLAERDNLLRVDVLIGPIHFGDVHQTFDTRFDFDKRTVVGDVRDLAEKTRSLRIATGNSEPRIFAQLLQAQRNTVLFLVELENLGFDFLTDAHNLARMTHASPSQIGDVEQAVDAAQIDERTVIGDVLDDTLDNSAFLESFK